MVRVNWNKEEFPHAPYHGKCYSSAEVAYHKVFTWFIDHQNQLQIEYDLNEEDNYNAWAEGWIDYWCAFEELEIEE